MNQCCTLLLLTLALTAPDGADAGLIFGGKEAAPHSRPYMVLVERKVPNGSSKYCGGFLLNKNFVMTAAHCTASSYNVILGLHNVRQQQTTKKIPVMQSLVAKDFDPDTLRNDILLLKLRYSATITPHVMPIALAGPEDAAPCSCSVAGWGYSDKHPFKMTEVLMEVDITLSPTYEDENFYYSVGNKGLGGGDSGGPLVCENGKAYGVASGVIEESKQHLFSKIQKHKEWIDSNINSV